MKNLITVTAVLIAFSAAAETIFYAPFDGTADAAVAGGNKTARVYGKIPYVGGIKGKAAVVGGKSNRIIFSAAENFNIAKGTCSFWVQPQNWLPSTQNFVFFVSFTVSHDKTVSEIMTYKICKTTNLGMLARNRATRKSIPLNSDIAFWQEMQWHNIVLTWDSSDITFYLDGQKVSAASRIQLPEEWKDIVIGAPYPSWGLIGEEKTAVDELIILDECLPEEKIAAQYRDEFTIFPEASPPGAIRHNSGSAISSSPEIKSQLAKKEQLREFKKDNNLALAANGAWILASSFSDHRDHYTDNLIDNDVDTVWQPKENEYPQYLELRWKFPREINKIAFHTTSGSMIEAASVETLDRKTGKWAVVKKASAAELKNAEIVFPGVVGDQFRLVIEKASGRIELAELEAYGPPQSFFGKNAPYWDAWYIWHPEPDQVYKVSQPRYFRRVFTVEDDTFKSAFIQARSNDYYRIWLNGVEVATGATLITPVNVGRHIRKGKNILAVESDLRRNPGKWGWGELIAELSINYQNGSFRLGTGPGWKSSEKESDRWKTGDFDDSGWKEVYCYKRPPDGPWGRIAYHSTSVREKIRFDGIEIAPTALPPGGEVTVSVRLQPELPLGRDYFFTFELGLQDLNPQSGDYVVTREVVNTTAVKGKTSPFTITAKIPLPPWTPSGNIPLYLRGYDKENGLELDFDGLEDNVAANIAIAPRAVTAPPIATAQIAYPNGQAAFVINEKATVPLFWRHIFLSHPKSFYTMAEYSDIKIHQFLLSGNIINRGNAGWADKMKNLEDKITTLLAISPDSGVIVLADLRPSMQWLQDNPGERLITAFGKPDVASFASRKYRDECREFCKFMLDYLKKRPYWDRIAGFHIWSCGSPDSSMGGVSDNLWQTRRDKITVGDFNPQALEMFRDFLRKKYHDDVAELRKSWKKPDITFAAVVPDIRELVSEGENGNVFRDPEAGRMTFDYAEFLPTMIGNFHRELCRFVKDETGWSKMLFVHYGYLIAHMQSYNSPGAPLNNNNFDLPDMLKDPAIDGYIGAPHYSFRNAGTPMVTYFPWTSIRLHNRMYLPDDDNRTYLAAPNTHGRNRSQRETRAIIRRNIGADITRNFGSWFADMSKGSGRSGVSWLGEKEVAEMIGEMADVYRKALKNGYRSASETAVIFSAETPRFMDIYYGPTLSNNLINWMWYTEFFKLGVPFDVYLTGDLRNPAFPAEQYKLIVMMNTFYLSDADRQAVEALKKDRRTFLWFYAPGYVDWHNGLQVDGIKALTGMEVSRLAGKEKMAAKLSDPGHPLSRGLPPDQSFMAKGFSYPATRKMHPAEFGPRFRIVDKKADIIAGFADGGGAVAARDFGHWKSVYSVIPRLERHFLRNICRWAGVHIYTEADVVFDANRNFIVLHNGYQGAKEIDLSLPRQTCVSDAISGEKLGDNVNQLKLRLEECSTRILYLE